MISSRDLRRATCQCNPGHISPFIHIHRSCLPVPIPEHEVVCDKKNSDPWPNKPSSTSANAGCSGCSEKKHGQGINRPRAEHCPFWESTCSLCKKKGHSQLVCCSKRGSVTLLITQCPWPRLWKWPSRGILLWTQTRKYFFRQRYKNNKYNIISCICVVLPGLLRYTQLTGGRQWLCTIYGVVRHRELFLAPIPNETYTLATLHPPKGPCCCRLPDTCQTCQSVSMTVWASSLPTQGPKHV